VDNTEGGNVESGEDESENVESSEDELKNDTYNVPEEVSNALGWWRFETNASL